MAKQVTTVSDEGFSATNEVREFETTIDATGEESPDTLEMLLASYASCYVPAVRVAGEQRGVGEVGRVEIKTTGELNDDDKLESISFDVHVEADVDDETAQKVIDRATKLCKVHDALKAELHAETTIEGDAF